MAAERSHAGTQLLGRYHVGELLAQGTLCAVYHGQDSVLRRPIIVKAAPAELIDTYRAALHLTAAFTHPVVVVTYDAVEQQDHLFLIQEYVQARPLAAYARDGVPSQRAVDLAAQIARALAYAHAHDIVHGDLTPSAILIDRQATVRINNFGLPPDTLYFSRQIQVVRDAYHASIADVIDLDAPTITQDAIGQSQAEPVAADDVRALGLLLWQILSEQTRTGPTANELGRRFRRDVPQALRDLILRCVLDDHPEHITEAGALLAELDAIAAVLTQDRETVAELTPPALRVAREAIAREAAWSVEETLGVLRKWPISTGGESVSPSVPTVADQVSGRPDAWPIGYSTPKIGPSRLSLPSRPLEQRAISSSREQDHNQRPRRPVERRASFNLLSWLDTMIGSVSVGRLVVYGLLLFLLFFLLGYFGPNILGNP